MSKNLEQASDWAGFKRNPARDRKSLLERMYVRVLTELATNRFKWVGMPSSCDLRYLELTLFNRALAVFYFDADYDKYFVQQCASTGPLNQYQNPTKFRTVSTTLYEGKELSGADCVPIWGNYLRQPDLDIVLVYATKLAEIDRTIEINIKGMRQPFLIAADESIRLSMMNAYRQVVEGQPVIFGTKNLIDRIEDGFKLLDMTTHPESVPNLLIAKSKIWAECMTLLGINNANQDKKERLVSDEVAANDEQILMSRQIALTSRVTAAEAISEKYGLSVSVEWNNNPPMSVSTTPDLVPERNE